MATNIVLQDKYFDKIDHSNDACFYLPDLNPGEPVILLGQCDRSIAGVPDFNIEKVRSPSSTTMSKHLL